MWLKLLFAVVSVFISIDSPTPNSPDQPVDPSIIPTDDSSKPTPNQPSNPTDNQSTPSVSDKDMLNLHIMVASHTDAGWIHTFEKYYQGTNSQDGGCVKCILDNVLSSLPGHADRKYDMSEISFFKRWWSDQGEEKRNRFKTMLQNKQFEFINGAWAANDEATAYYEGIMDNFILGHRWLQDTLGVDPLIGWQVDSFGNSATHAGLMAQAGYEGMFFSRADYVDRDTRRASKSLQYNWAPPNPHNESVFTQMMYVTYSDTKFMIPDNYNCRSVFCNGNLTPPKYQQVTDYAKKQQAAFKTKNILFMVCDDFLLWRGAEQDYVGAEAMVKYYHDNPQFGIKAKISHLSEYLHQVKEDLISMGEVGNIPEKHDDTFPYVEKAGHVWTGYFTSKPMFKLMVREYGEYYNTVKLMMAKMMLADNWNADQHAKVNQQMTALEEPLAIVQHHDAVSGTMKENVRFDYEDMLNRARDQLEGTISPMIISYLKGKINENLTPHPFKYDWFFRDTKYSNAFDDKTTTFTVFNPGQTRKMMIRVKLPTAEYVVRDEANNLVDTDLICHSEDSNSECYIYFVDEFPSYITRAYKLNKSTAVQKVLSWPIDRQAQDLSVGGLTFKANADLKSFEYNYCKDNNCVGDTFNLDYNYYESAKQGSDSPSGAYVFTPVPQQSKEYSPVKSGRVFKGKHISIAQIFRNNLRTDISVHNHQPERGVEINTFLDPVTVQPSGKDIVLLVSSSIKNGNTEFYTDANGYYMQKRVKNHKDNFNLDARNSINVNFYPMTSNMYIQDESSGKRLSIVTDRAQGVSSLNPGQVEVMIHRVTTNDDWKGVGEPLQERDRGTGNFIRVTTRHFLSFSNSGSGVADQRRNQQYDLDRAAQLRFYGSDNAEFYAGAANDERQGQQVVPDLVKLYVRSYEANEYTVRLHNLDEASSKQVQVYDLQSKLSGLLEQLAGKSVKVKSIEELSWMTTREKSDVLKNVLDPNEPDVTHQDGQEFSAISLLPMEIRTFSIEVEV